MVTPKVWGTTQLKLLLNLLCPKNGQIEKEVDLKT